MDPLINGMRVAILVTDGFEQIELTEAKAALEREGATTEIISNKTGKVQAVNRDREGDQFSVHLTFDQADPASYDAIVLPGGAANAERIRAIPEAQQLVQAMVEEGKPVGAICHGTLLLVSAGLADGRNMTSWPALEQEIRNAGGNWMDQEVVVDGNLVTSRKPEDLPAFTQKLVEAISARMQANLRGTADEHAVGIASS